MVKRTDMQQELGAAGSYDPNRALKHDAFLYALRGRNAMRVYREMALNSPVVGGVMQAIELSLRSVDWQTQAADTPNGKAAAELLESCLDDMQHTMTDFLSDVATTGVYGFSLFEMVFKRRMGERGKHPSQYADGMIGIHKLAPRAQWTIERFHTDAQGEVQWVEQRTNVTGKAFVQMPYSKLLHFRTTSGNGDPSGRSLLRNAYVPYHYSKRIQEYEAIAIERELNGLPVARIPMSYLAATQGPQKLFRDEMETIMGNLRKNEQGYLIIPSDTYTDADGKPTTQHLVEVELMSSGGTRDMDTTKVVVRHEQNIARSVLADFIMLGSTQAGSFALSESKTSLFLQGLESSNTSAADQLNRRLVQPWSKLNGIAPEDMPTLVPGRVGKQDLELLGRFLGQLSVAGMPLFPDQDLENVLRSAAGMPERTGVAGMDDDSFLSGGPRDTGGDTDVGTAGADVIQE